MKGNYDKKRKDLEIPYDGLLFPNIDVNKYIFKHVPFFLQIEATSLWNIKYED